MKQLGICQSIVVLLGLAVSSSIVSYSFTYAISSSDERVDLVSDAPSSPTTKGAAAAAAQQYPVDEAEFIIQKSYAETYARMFPCSHDDIERQCIAKVVEDLNRNRTHDDDDPPQNRGGYFRVPPDHPYPWWFRTLLRDVPGNGAYGWWHHFSTVATDPPLRFCAIGKNGSTEWRKVFKALNAPEFCEGGVESKDCSSKFNTQKILSGNGHGEAKIPDTVFVRDPLERLLSGYLDKCVKPGVRTSQGHCAPNEVFGVDFLERKAKRAKSQKGRGKDNDERAIIPPDLTTVVQDLNEEMFATYVDLVPLQWNVHFVPQAIFCDLYRTVDSYDFVGVMGRDFPSELRRMADRYGGTLPGVLDDVFRYRSKLGGDDARTTASRNVGTDKAHGTKAPEKVRRYYTARTVRRALEYLSIDYVTLGMEVPEWAREMLRGDGS